MKILKWIGASLFILVLLILAISAIFAITRGTPVTHVRSLGTPRAVADSLFVRELSLLTSTTMEPGHHIELLANGDGTFPRLWSDLRQARRSITLHLFWVRTGALANSLKAILSERARAGVPVFFLYDGYGSELTDEYKEELTRAGVRVATFRPVKWYALHKAQHRSHTRAIVIDGVLAYTGGFGVGDDWAGNGHRKDQWRDTNARFSGPAVGQAQAAFVAGWAEATGELLTGDLFFPTPQPAITAGTDTAAVSAGALGGLMHAVPSLGSTSAERLFALAISAARQRLYISNAYFVPDDDFRRLLRDAAKRGADVRVLAPGEETDVPLTRFAAHRHYEELLRAGVRIFEYQPTMMHAKTISADGVLSIVGTTNFDNRSLALNEESNLLVYDAGVTRALDSLFVDDLRYSREVRLETFRRRPWYHRVRERLAVTLSRIL